MHLVPRHSVFMSWLSLLRRNPFQNLLLTLLMLASAFSFAVCAGGAEQSIQQPLHLPKLAPGSSCPITIERRVTPIFGLALGKGPVYPVAPWSHGTYYYGESGTGTEASILKVLWIGRPEYQGEVLIRGHQLDGPNDLFFRRELNSPINLELSLSQGNGGSNPGGWRGWPSDMIVYAPGCYAYQIDGAGFSEVVTFKLVNAPSWASGSIPPSPPSAPPPAFVQKNETHPEAMGFAPGSLIKSLSFW